MFHCISGVHLIFPSTFYHGTDSQILVHIACISEYSTRISPYYNIIIYVGCPTSHHTLHRGQFLKS